VVMDVCCCASQLQVEHSACEGAGKKACGFKDMGGESRRSAQLAHVSLNRLQCCP
jgi:hypothetical protein